MTITYFFVLFILILIMLLLAFQGFATIIGLIRAKGVPFVALTKKQLQYLGKKIKLSPSDKVVDLGCGDGKVLRMFEGQGVKTLHGYEVNLWAFTLAWVKNRFAKSKSRIFFKNFDKVDLSQYNVVFCYLLGSYLVRLRDKFDKELKPGTKIVCFAFKIKNWKKPEQIIENDKHIIYIYKI